MTHPQNSLEKGANAPLDSHAQKSNRQQRLSHHNEAEKSTTETEFSTSLKFGKWAMTICWRRSHQKPATIQGFD